MAVKLLHSDPDYGVSEFLNWLNSWAKKRKSSGHATSKRQKLLQPLSDLAQQACEPTK